MYWQSLLSLHAYLRPITLSEMPHIETSIALQEMGRLCKPEGRILLLQHGRASPDWLNKWLDEGAHKHLMKWGCQWNRDIESIVKEVSIKQSVR